MSDPLYGDNPIDALDTWYRYSRPPLVNDAESSVWKTVIVAMMNDLLESSWLVRWRVGSPVTAEGIHLDAVGADFGLLRPDGWGDERWGPVLVAVDGAFISGRTPDVTAALADALEQPGQSWEMDRPGNLEYVVYFYGISADEAETYREILEFGRPKGVGFEFIWSNAPKADTFVLDDSLLDGPDVLAAP